MIRDTQFGNKAYEQTLGVELCGTAGLTPPTTPPHKPAEDELFKPEGKGGESPPKVSWASRRKLPEQTELYAHLRKMGQISDSGHHKGVPHRAYGDHDYCLQGLGESRKRPAPSCSSSEEEREREEESGVRSRLTEQVKLFSKLPDYLCNGRERKIEDEEEEEDERRTASPQALSPQNSEEGGERPPTPNHTDPCTSCCLPSPLSSKLSFSCENLGTCQGEKQRSKNNEDCRVFYIHNLPGGVTQAMLRRRFEAFGEPEDCKIFIKNEERCGVITFLRPPSGQGQRHRRDSAMQNSGSGSPRRFCRKRYIDLDEAGPGPVKSKYDALDFDTLLKEAQRSLHR
ncbi:hypothetical protein JZ751_007321 [Albula glossodonta]|uniref:RRM domain-containing protein n=1 Tax=Albula glossodonta TaxID=121402 RepID=A0A8T2NAF2_9TELE|nr:hypothetical protein JZ751_007321 [Albula glossodonta]